MILRNTRTTGIFLLFILVTVIPVAATSDASTLSVVSIPQGGVVFIDGTHAGTTPVTTLLISPGTHTIMVSKEGYEDYTSPVHIEEGSHQDFLANLQRLENRGRARIQTVPPGGALYVDGRYQNITMEPVIVENLIPGRHDLLIQKAGYEDYRDVISIAAGTMVEYTEYMVPLPDSGFLSITSSPAGADVSIDGSNAGKTPTNLLRSPAGNHTIRLAKSGYWNFTGIIHVSGGEATRVTRDLVQIPTSSTLYVDSSPPGLEIYLNETFKGTTPATFSAVPSGAYHLEFRRQHAATNQTFRFQPGATYELYALLPSESEGSIITKEWLYQNKSIPSTPGWIEAHATPVIEKTFMWYTNGQESSVTLDIPQDMYEYYKSQPHPADSATLATYAINDQDRQYFHTLINKLKDASDFKSYAARNDYRNVVAFAQSIPYEDDKAVTGVEEYWKYPLETLADGRGDCEDTAILTAALLKEMGYDVAVVLLPEHAAVAVTCETCNGYYYPLNGKRYYYLETTGSGFSPGAMDPQYQTASADVIPI